MTRFALLCVLAACASEGSSASDVLCDPSDGVWTRLFVAQEQCSVRTLGGPDFGVAYQERNCRAMVEPLLANGTVELASASVIESCRQAIASHTCSPTLAKDFRAATKICDDVLVGLQQSGQACSSSDECAGSSFCALAGTCGACSPLRANDSACESSGDCTSGACSNGVCIATNLAAGSACQHDAQCGNGLRCTASVCAKPLALGATCTNGVGCDITTSSCVTPQVDGVFDEHGTCKPLGKLGTGCEPFGTAQISRANCDWLAGLGCIAGVCSTLPEVAVGSACGFDQGRCDSSAMCVGGTCRKLAGENEFCDDSITCGPYAACVEHACLLTEFNGACYAADDEPATPGI